MIDLLKLVGLAYLFYILFMNDFLQTIFMNFFLVFILKQYLTEIQFKTNHFSYL